MGRQPRDWQGEFYVRPEDLRAGWHPSDVGPIGPPDAIDPVITRWRVPLYEWAPWGDMRILIRIEGTAEWEAPQPSTMLQPIEPVVFTRPPWTPAPDKRRAPHRIILPDAKERPVHCSLAGADPPWLWSWADGFTPFSEMTDTSGPRLTKEFPY